jgi:hypothetical protein
MVIFLQLSAKVFSVGHYTINPGLEVVVSENEYPIILQCSDAVENKVESNIAVTVPVPVNAVLG